jgi:hypothetical protein
MIPIEDMILALVATGKFALPDGLTRGIGPGTHFAAWLLVKVSA